MKKNKRHAIVLLFLALALCVKLFFWPSQAPEPTTTNLVNQASTPPSPSPAPPLKPQLTLQHTKSTIATPPLEVTPQPTVEQPTENQNKILCEHIISGESRYEFNGQIRLINKGKEPIYGWSVEWEYPDGSTLFDSAEVALAGSNPYRGEYLDSNAEIAPGKTVTFYFSGMKGGESSPTNVNVAGDFCM